MSARVLVIGLDAAEATLLERWAEEGDLPAFARLARDGGVARLGNSLETLPGAIWPELTTGVSGGRTGLYYHPRQIHSGETALRRVEPEDVDTSLYYWVRASDAGKRVAVLDQPQTVPHSVLNGVMLTEWGLHDRNFAIASEPPELLEEIRARWGDHPVSSCDAHGGTREGYDWLLGALLAGAERKTDLLLELLNREDWDLFVATFGETHCAGHQFWHFFDPAQPGHDPDAPDHLRLAVKTIYERVDQGVGALLDAAGPETTVFVVASHGMGTYIGGYQLLSEFLVRIGLSSGKGTTAQVRSRLPVGVRTTVRKLVPGRVRTRVQERAGSLPRPLESPHTRAIDIPNNRCGGVRLNLRGREPHGSIEPGAEERAVLEEIRQALYELEDPDSGERIIKEAITAEEAFGENRHPDIPDLMVVFRTDLCQIVAARSERVGLLRADLFNPYTPRSGDHTVESRLWAVGPTVPAGARLPEGNVLDLAATVLETLAVPLPAHLDGRPLAGLAPQA